MKPPHVEPTSFFTSCPALPGLGVLASDIQAQAGPLFLVAERRHGEPSPEEGATPDTGSTLVTVSAG